MTTIPTDLQAPPPWLVEAYKHEGLKEISGKAHNKTIVSWLTKLNAWWREDETPWCGTFVAHCLTTANRSLPKHWYRAKAYLDYGTELTKPAYGCIAVTGREGGGHVFFVVGETPDGQIVGFGGNQSNAVNLRKFPKNKILGYRWPSHANGVPSLPYNDRYKLPRYTDNLLSVGSMA